MIVEFGLNFNASAFGVSSVWMNIVRRACADGSPCRTAGWLKGWIVGLCLLLEDEIGVVLGELENPLFDVEVASL